MTFILACVDGGLSNHQVCFFDAPGKHGRRLECNGTPFMIVGRRFLECHQGPLRRKPTKSSVSVGYSAVLTVVSFSFLYTQRECVDAAYLCRSMRNITSMCSYSVK